MPRMRVVRLDGIGIPDQLLKYYDCDVHSLWPKISGHDTEYNG